MKYPFKRKPLRAVFVQQYVSPSVSFCLGKDRESSEICVVNQSNNSLFVAVSNKESCDLLMSNVKIEVFLLLKIK